MQYKLINEHEPISITVKKLDRAYKSTDAERINSFDCDIYRRGKYWLIQQGKDVLYYEYHSFNYPFFEMALYRMEPKAFGEWKTVSNLISFRQAIREDVINYRGLLNMITEKMTEDMFNAFMIKSREVDILHHGQHTF